MEHKLDEWPWFPNIIISLNILHPNPTPLNFLYLGSSFSLSSHPGHSHCSTECQVLQQQITTKALYKDQKSTPPSDPSLFAKKHPNTNVISLSNPTSPDPTF
jgi:hypothetical protein